MPHKPLTSSPFHKGEKAVQERVGVSDQVEHMGRQMIRDLMPEQHQIFFANQPFLFAGTVDKDGWPQASIIFDEKQFVSFVDPKNLVLSNSIQAYPPLGALDVGDEIGMLGIEFETRRRNRVNSVLVEKTAEGMQFKVQQSFGACPKYIQNRHIIARDATPETESIPPQVSSSLAENAKAIIRQADTFFVASQYAGDDNPRAHGVDVSNRGGNPGFVRIEDDNTVIWPDYLGNFMFCTMGNLQANPKSGLLFIDFESGDVLHLTGEASIVWDEELIEQFKGAQRFVRFKIRKVLLLEEALPFRWELKDFSPVLAQTGSWDEVMAPKKKQSCYRDMMVDRIEKESDLITSFYLRAKNGDPLADYLPGQFLPIRFDISGLDKPILRTYTVSNAPGNSHYRLSIKREAGQGDDIPPGMVSSYFHDHLQIGDRISAAKPTGKFHLNPSDRPVVLLSGGVGITPMIAILDHLVQTGDSRPVYFIHGAQNGKVHAFGDHVQQLTAQNDLVTSHIRYSDPVDDDQLAQNHHSVGHVDMDLLQKLLPFGDYDFYLCGPPPFMKALFQGLRDMNVADDRIHFEFFGPATVLRKSTDKGIQAPAEPRPPVKVTFKKSAIETTWYPDKGSLLDLAEAEGLTPDYSCREGSCGTCATKILSGDVTYEEEPFAIFEDGRALICCADPGKSDEDLSFDL